MSAIILVVDDNPELVDGVKLTLEMEEYQVLSATNGVEAMNVLERITPDLILADIMMPEMDGYELYERVHSDPRWVQVPFIFLTAKTDKADIRRGKEMGVDDYITKPFDPQDIVAAIRGRLKRLAEVTGRPAPGDVIGTIKYLWGSKLGPMPVPVVTLMIVLILLSVPLLVVFRIIPQQVFQAPQEPIPFKSPLRPDVGEMITISAGEFLMGSDAPGAPQPRRVRLPDFQIDKYETTNAQYRVFAEETDHPAPEGVFSEEMADYPVTNVSWEDARAYCEWAEKRLPTDAEWEKAARGSEGLTYPWGNEWRDGLANTRESGRGSVSPVGSFSAGASPYGVHDMAGNVWEWVEDWAVLEQTKIIRGGAWNAVSRWAQTFAHNETPPSYTQDNLGFRCAR
ncbi:MAG: hypothetical protein B6I35_03245 [Anaerolineaceae bacterium 4572_32.2]|nr:MAG: hypothetical protein B6I35_03245 [Anaerolineaceae bacterium 4572_32.2]RLC80240.1 MAG: hypothetical protein DRI81_04365 [Chloroflexota bacterium]HEY73141.1 SUMF1/EgtB/PvdO family nonheme iron enzyme [Thermoflexia bacterium]